MPHVVHAGVRIHYAVQGDGPPLVLHHGSGSNSAAWIQQGYAKLLRARYRLVLIDARGHGQSDKPHDPSAHTLELRVGDVTCVLDALEIERAHFFGYSMGGWIGFGMAKYARPRLRSLIIGGAHPYADQVIAEVELSNSDDRSFLTAMERVLGEPLAAETQRFLLRNDRTAVLASLKQRSEISEVQLAADVSALLFAGSADRRHDLVERAAAAIPGAQFVSFPELGHLGTFACADWVLPHVTRFLDATESP